MVFFFVVLCVMLHSYNILFFRDDSIFNKVYTWVVFVSSIILIVISELYLRSSWWGAVCAVVGVAGLLSFVEGLFKGFFNLFHGIVFYSIYTDWSTGQGLDWKMLFFYFCISTLIWFVFNFARSLFSDDGSQYEIPGNRLFLSAAFLIGYFLTGGSILYPLIGVILVLIAASGCPLFLYPDLLLLSIISTLLV